MAPRMILDILRPELPRLFPFGLVSGAGTWTSRNALKEHTGHIPFHCWKPL